MSELSSHQESLKRRWDEKVCPHTSSGGAGATAAVPPSSSSSAKPLGLWPLGGEETASSSSAAAAPPVTVVLEGRSICHRVHLHNHASYESLALTLRRLFVDGGDDDEGVGEEGRSRLDLSNAVPGHVVAYEDMEDDLLLAGDLDWKDFVRVAKRIRILPAKGTRKRDGCST